MKANEMKQVVVAKTEEESPYLGSEPITFDTCLDKKLYCWKATPAMAIKKLMAQLSRGTFHYMGKEYLGFSVDAENSNTVIFDFHFKRGSHFSEQLHRSWLCELEWCTKYTDSNFKDCGYIVSLHKTTKYQKEENPSLPNETFRLRMVVEITKQVKQ